MTSRLGEEMVADLRRCITTNLNCADVCFATGKMLSRQTAYDGELTRAVLTACRQACRRCAEECERHADRHEHCRICSELCRACEAVCDRPGRLTVETKRFTRPLTGPTALQVLRCLPRCSRA